MIIFTSICANYAHKARCLAESVHAHIPDAKFFVCLTEREVPEAMASDARFDRIVLSKDAWDGNFDRFIFKHSIVEASTAVKGQFFRWLQKEFPREDCYIYLDPDCYVYSDFPEIREALKTKPAVLCPHLLHPGNVDMELSSTAHGVYNLGFLAVNGSEEAHRIIDWWAERLYLYCYDDIANGIFTDQKWMDLAPCFFDVQIMRHYGYDLAPWGLLHTAIEKKNGEWLIQGMPLRFIHYSGFGPVAEMCMSKWLDDSNQGFHELYDDYAKAHAANNADNISKTPWSYAAYHSGEEILREVRDKYRHDWDLMFSLEDPFEKSNDFFMPQPEPEPLPEMPENPGKTAITRKWYTARRVMRDQGISGILSVLSEKTRRRES